MFLVHSPVIGVADYRYEEYIDGSIVPVCLTQADTFWPAFFFIASISLFFALPLAVLVVLYTIIARHLMAHPGIMAPCSGGGNVLRYRKQVVLMLGTVVLSFFVCLLPFRALTLWIILVPPEAVMALGIEGYYNLLYFCRIMLYLNSCINPILYNLMSSKFRDGFLRLCGWGKNGRLGENFLGRKGTFNTTSTTCSSSHPNRPSPDSFWRRSFTSRGSSIRLSLHNGSSPPTVSANGCLLTRGRNSSHYGNQHSVFLNRCGSVEGKAVCANNRRDESYV